MIMEQSKSLFVFRIVTILGILTICYLLLFHQKVSNPSNEVIKNLEKQNNQLSSQNDSLKYLNSELQLQVVNYQLQVDQKQKQLIFLKNQKYEEINRIINLPLDSAILFLSNNLSE